ncbi:MAG: GGDEF domain-containing protein [Gammaproteobacteria bacterium]
MELLTRCNRAIPLVASYGLGFLLAYIDYRTGVEISLTTLYLVPISALTYTRGRLAGFVIATFLASIWLATKLLTNFPYSHPLIPFWNALAGFVSFVVVVMLLSALKESVGKEARLARTDTLTGAGNRRLFYEMAEDAITRSKRYGHSLSVVHIDIDNFKMVNDACGHYQGDDLLRTVVKAILRKLRKTDTLARIGGDEFVILLPQTGANGALKLVREIKYYLAEEMKRHAWPVSFSIGVLTCHDPPKAINELLRNVDNLTYAAKRSGKNTIKSRILPMPQRFHAGQGRWRHASECHPAQRLPEKPVEPLLTESMALRDQVDRMVGGD